MKKRWIVTAGIACALGLGYALITLREYADHNRLKLFSESVRIGMPKKELNAFTNAYVTWLDMNLPEEEFIYEVDDTVKTNTWHFVRYSRPNETPMGTYSEIYHLKIKLKDNKVSTKKYWKTKCFASPEWAKPHIDFDRCF